MDDEGTPEDSTLDQAVYWTQIYGEILTYEMTVLAQMQELMIGRSGEARREIELTNIPVVAAQAEKFRKRHGYWSARVQELQSRGR